MASYAKTQARASGRREETEFRVIYMATFVFFLIAVLIMRLVPKSWRSPAASLRQRKSILAETREIACSTIPYAFMS